MRLREFKVLYPMSPDRWVKRPGLTLGLLHLGRTASSAPLSEPLLLRQEIPWLWPVAASTAALLRVRDRTHPLLWPLKTCNHLTLAFAPLSKRNLTICWCPALVQWKRAVQPWMSFISSSAPCFKRIRYKNCYKMLQCEIRNWSQIWTSKINIDFNSKMKIRKNKTKCLYY